MMRLKNLLLEAEYTHVGYGKYKEKGKEKDPNAQTFKKTDQGKYVPIKSDEPTSGKDTKKDTPKVNIFDKPAKEKTKKSDTPKVSPTKLTKLMPNANKDTFSGESDINKIPDAQKKEISMRIDKLAELTKQAKEKGEAAPNYNLCKVTVPGTNLYCEGNAGIPREEMPQFKGKPTPGSPASKMPVDASGEVDTEPMFKKMLKEKGIKTAETEIPSDALKATQSELVGSKVAGMAKALEKDPNHPAITAPIYVSRDGFVIDGHHRWAAVTSAAIAAGKPANMKVIVIDMDIKDAIPLANSFAEEIGVAAKKADANKETPSKEEPKQSSKPDTQGDKFELGTPAVYTDNGQEYRGEVVMNPSNQRVQINGQWTTIGKGTTKGIQVYGSDTFIVPDDWNDAKSFDDAMKTSSKDKSSSKEPDYKKYTDKSETMTDFFKGNLSIEDLKKVADKNFGSSIATEKDLDGFLNNKFMQDVMADEHGVDRDTLISKVKELKSALFGGTKQESYKGRISLKRLVEAKKYDIGSGWMGNGLTIWNRAEEQHGDYKIIAHIGKDGTLSIRDKQLPTDIKKMFQIWADSMKKGDRPGTY